MSHSKWSRTESSVEAWTPDEVLEQKINFIPPEFIEAVNELLAKGWSGSSASFSITALKALAREKLIASSSPNIRKNFSEEGWYDFEPIYRAKGWRVECDSPGYNESYETRWTFSRRR